ncbi:MAG: hypothetical protein ACKVS8_05135 [Phycisphaerales bacterium]
MRTVTDTVHIATPVEATALATRNGLLVAIRDLLPPGRWVRAVRIRTDGDTLVGEIDREWRVAAPDTHTPGAGGAD